MQKEDQKLKVEMIVGEKRSLANQYHLKHKVSLEEFKSCKTLSETKATKHFNPGLNLIRLTQTQA